MEILYALIPLSIVLLTVAIYILSWAVKSGQYDDLEGPAHKILYDDDEDMIPTNKPKSEHSESKDKSSL
ncbi:MAG: cbb3-type cytochrome oxidase assembly protein CcoS [Gammaproteobacteria bacterium]|nr:MAG: cbb3-type cytochrome oxidase assembly protein CcoS [Gammaproteobacteria bacterium]